LNFFAGRTGVGADPESNVQLRVERAETGSVASAAGVHVELEYSGATGTGINDFRGVDIDISNTSTTNDISDAAGVYVNAPTSAAGGIGDAYGLYVEDLRTDTDVTAGWGVYQLGSTMKNRFDGVLGCKNASPSVNYAIDAGDDINLGSGYVYRVNGTQVVTAQQSAIADVGTPAQTGVDTTCRNKVNDILAMLRTHGLIDT
jgi:hypothetical protein